jgi:hypothetical protein
MRQGRLGSISCITPAEIEVVSCSGALYMSILPPCCAMMPYDNGSQGVYRLTAEANKRHDRGAGSDRAALCGRMVGTDHLNGTQFINIGAMHSANLCSRLAVFLAQLRNAFDIPDLDHDRIE